MSDRPFPINAFADRLRALRAERGLSVREMAKESGVSFSLISALENGRRSAGLTTLTKLAAALRLRGAEREKFLTAGGDTSARHRIQVDEKRKGMRLLGDLIAVLAGVKHDDIGDIVVEYRSADSKVAYDFVVRMRDGHLLAGEIKRDKIVIVPSEHPGVLPDLRSSKAGRARIIPIPR